MNEMDEHMDSVEEHPDSLGGRNISRRDMIKASVIAGGLVWTAPVLLSGKAAAQVADPCCPDGTVVTLRVDITDLDNLVVSCDTTCLPDDPGCDTEFVQCLIDNFFSVTNPGNSIVFNITPAVTVLAVAAVLDDPPSCVIETADANCEFDTSAENGIGVNVQGDGSTKINFPSGNLDGEHVAVELRLCLSDLVSPICP